MEIGSTERQIDSPVHWIIVLKADEIKNNRRMRLKMEINLIWGTF